MQAFLLAAGLGTRLRPLTDSRPKALVEVGGEPLLKVNIDRLAAQGADRIVVNVHHFADQVVEYLAAHSWPAEILVSDERTLLLDTGGGLKKAAPLFRPGEAVLVHNVDILSRLDLRALWRRQQESGALATLAVSRRDTARQLLFSPDGRLAGWHNRQSGEVRWAVDTSCGEPRIGDYTDLAFSGIAVVSPQMLDLLPEASVPYPVIPAYLDAARDHVINHFLHPADNWLDVGKPETLQQAQAWKRS